MWSEACALLDAIEQRQRHFARVWAAPAAAPAWEAPANIFASASELQVTLALPGARAEQIRIELHGGGLEIEALVAPPVFADGMSVVRLEIPYGRMIRRIDLPPGRFALLEHRYEHGCLHLRLQRLVP
jgi:HSP20 family molecular chaperone IbpA